MPNFIKSEKLFLIFLFAFNFLFRLFRIQAPAESFLNEKYYILPAARDILLGFGDTKPITPPSPLGKLLFASSIKLFGDNPFGWRILPVLFTAALVILTYFLAKEIFKNRAIATTAGILLTFEAALFVHSRSADPEVFLVTFIILSMIFVWKVCSENKLIWTVSAGVSSGLALTIKPQASLAIVAGLVTILFLAKEKLRSRILSTFLILIISSFIYLIAYLPVFQKSGISGYILLHQNIKQYHTQYWPENYYKVMSQSEYGPRLPQFNQYLRYPITWLKNPKILYFEKGIDSKKRLVLFTFNPMIFFPAIGAFLFGLVLAINRRDLRIVFLLLTASFFYFPYLFSSLYKPLTYPPYYLLSSFPLLIILLSYLLDFVRKKARFIFIVYLVLVVVTFAAYYPLLAALPVTYDYFHFLTGLT